MQEGKKASSCFSSLWRRSGGVPSSGDHPRKAENDLAAFQMLSNATAKGGIPPHPSPVFAEGQAFPPLMQDV